MDVRTPVGFIYEIHDQHPPEYISPAAWYNKRRVPPVLASPQAANSKQGLGSLALGPLDPALSLKHRQKEA